MDNQELILNKIKLNEPLVGEKGGEGVSTKNQTPSELSSFEEDKDNMETKRADKKLYTYSFEGIFNMNNQYPAEVKKAREKTIKNMIIDPVTKKPLVLNVNPQELKSYSVLYPMFFDFLHTCLTSLIILFIISCIFDLIASYFITIYLGDENVYSIGPQDLYQICSFSTFASILNSDNDNKIIIYTLYLGMKMILNVSSTIYLRNYVKKVYDRLLDRYDFSKIKNFSECDFCILLSNIPTNITYHEFINKLQAFNHTIEIHNIKGVLMLQNCEKYMKFANHKIKLLRQLNKSKAKGGDVEVQINSITDKMNNFILNSVEHPEFIGKVLICFENLADKKRFSEEFNTNNQYPFEFLNKILSSLRIGERPLQPMLCGSLVRAETVPEPGDVKWENLHLSQQELSIRKLFAYVFLSISVVALSFILLYLAYGKISNNSNSSLLNYNAIILTIGIGIIKILIEILIQLIAKMTRMISNSSMEMFKLKGRLIFSFINLYAVIYSTEFFYGKTNQDQFILNLFLTLLLMIVLPQILAWLDPELLTKVIKRLAIQNKILDNNRTQKACNDLFVNPEFPFMIRVNDAAQVYFLALSFYTIFPLAVPICIVGLYAIWLNDKFMILRIYSRTKLMRLDLGLWFFKVFEYNILIQVVGNGFYLLTLSAYYSPLTVAGISISITIIMSMIIILIIYYCKFHVVFGNDQAKRRQNGFTNEIYDDVKGNFPTTYHMEYPLNNSKRVNFRLD